MTVSDIITHTQEMDFTLRYCAFLDDFKRASNKAALVVQEPPESSLYEPHEYALLAAAVHLLCNRDGVSVPTWVMKDKYKLTQPSFAFGTQNKKYQEFLKETTMPEFSMRNLYYGDNAVNRI